MPFPTNDPERPRTVCGRPCTCSQDACAEKNVVMGSITGILTFDEHRIHYRKWSPLRIRRIVLHLNGEVYATKETFFIMVSMNPPHSPYRSLDDCMEEDFNLYKNQPLDSLLVRPNADSKMLKAERVHRYYFASVTGVDRAGQILDALKELGLDKNTIVVFASPTMERPCVASIRKTRRMLNSRVQSERSSPGALLDKIKPRVDRLRMLSSPDIIAYLVGSCRSCRLHSGRGAGTQLCTAFLLR